jgi:hypothetical protein
MAEMVDVAGSISVFESGRAANFPEELREDLGAMKVARIFFVSRAMAPRRPYSLIACCKSCE